MQLASCEATGLCIQAPGQSHTPPLQVVDQVLWNQGVQASEWEDVEALVAGVGVVVTDTGSHLRLIESCITQLIWFKDFQGPVIRVKQKRRRSMKRLTSPHTCFCRWWTRCFGTRRCRLRIWAPFRSKVNGFV